MGALGGCERETMSHTYRKSGGIPVATQVGEMWFLKVLPRKSTRSRLGTKVKLKYKIQ